MIIVISVIFQGKVCAGESTRIISLEDAIRIGLKNNKSFLLELEQIKMSAKNAYLDAKGEYTRPSIDLITYVSEKQELKVSAKQRFLIPKTGTIISLENSYNLLKGKGTDTVDTTISLNLSQPLSPKEVLVNKRILRDIEDDYNLSMLILKSKKEDFISKVINTYVNFIKQEMSIERSRERIKMRDELLRIAELRYKAGEIPKIDIVDMELQNKLEKINLLTEEDNYRKSKKEFLKLLGLEEEDDFLISHTIKPFFNKLPSVSEAIVKAKDHQLIRHRLSLKRKEEALKEAQLSKNLAVFLEAGYSTQVPLFSSSRKRKDESQVGIKMEYKIYDNKRYKRHILQLQKELEIERHNFEELNKKIIDEIEELFKEIDLIKQKSEIFTGIEKIAQSSLEAGKLKFKMGMISQTELNDIIERYNKVQEEKVNMEIGSFLLGVRLLTLIGELTSFFEKE